MYDPVTPLAPERLLEVVHVAHRLGKSQHFVRRLIRDQRLKALFVGSRWAIEPKDLRTYEAGCREAGVLRVQRAGSR